MKTKIKDIIIDIFNRASSNNLEKFKVKEKNGYKYLIYDDMVLFSIDANNSIFINNNLTDEEIKNIHIYCIANKLFKI